MGDNNEGQQTSDSDCCNPDFFSIFSTTFPRLPSPSNSLLLASFHLESRDRVNRSTYWRKGNASSIRNFFSGFLLFFSFFLVTGITNCDVKSHFRMTGKTK